MHLANAIPLFRTNGLDRAAARHLQRRRAADELVRVRHGVYVDRAGWEELDGRSQHLVRMRAVAPLLRPGAVFAFESAAALHGVPRIDRWTDRVRAIVPSLEHDVHRVGLTMHAGSTATSGYRYWGIDYASLVWTTVETARRGSLSAAVVAIDHALRNGVSLGELERVAAEVGPWGSVRLEHAFEIADARHESVGESFFAARAAELGCPDLEPQHEFVYPDGTVDRVDFWLPRQGLVLEFDGRQKYEDPVMLAGRDARDVLWAEKRREDRLRSRSEVRGVVRADWSHLVEPERLRALFRTHGVPCR
ncbi:hypothetical protein FHW23_003096 [Curtobacterium pusillum]|uniref:Transcriptional regulator, AbiEi antitoxin, Type IV TA system n=1 Tax=Curtobacterium pusillum TaxID=69373 RepID=A0AAW3TD43_9MICO|nr:hypothetical protein [Curtobacterium pusillum]MBA8991818.1 hypothetical protein [Curtobacterium pusillum]